MKISYIILVVSIIGYSVLASLIFDLLKEVQRIHKILWKVAQKESMDFLLKDSDKNSKNPINKC